MYIGSGVGQKGGGEGDLVSHLGELADMGEAAGGEVTVIGCSQWIITPTIYTGKLFPFWYVDSISSFGTSDRYTGPVWSVAGTFLGTFLVLGAQKDTLLRVVHICS